MVAPCLQPHEAVPLDHECDCIQGGIDAGGTLCGQKYRLRVTALWLRIGRTPDRVDEYLASCCDSGRIARGELEVFGKIAVITTRCVAARRAAVSAQSRIRRRVLLAVSPLRQAVVSTSASLSSAFSVQVSTTWQLDLRRMCRTQHALGDWGALMQSPFCRSSGAT